jgi:hypothetical protein
MPASEDDRIKARIVKTSCNWTFKKRKHAHISIEKTTITHASITLKNKTAIKARAAVKL